MPKRRPAASNVASLRIVGGDLGGRTLRYNGDPATRPMKDRVREAVFNLVGPGVKQTLALDLFSGTGAMALEAISRGAGQAIAIERRFPNVKTIQENAAHLGVASQIEAIAGDAFSWFERTDVSLARPWLVFCCPPYEFYVSRTEEMLHLIRQIGRRAPDGSLLVVESDDRFDTLELPESGCWDTRCYPPAVVSLCPIPFREKHNGHSEP